MEASRPLGHPTPADMEPPQVEQALALAEMARERCMLSYSSCTPPLREGGDENGTSAGGETTSIGLLPLALAWEGSALALLAAGGTWAKHVLTHFCKYVYPELRSTSRSCVREKVQNIFLVLPCGRSVFAGDFPET